MCRIPTLVLILAISSVAFADSWPNWRGPKRDGTSAEKELLAQWKEAPPLVWKSDALGSGYAGVVVDGGIVCTMGHRNGKAIVIALGDKDGKELWTAEAADSDNRASASMCTPTIDGDRIFAVSGNGLLVCLKTATGELVWKKSFKVDYQGETQQFGYAESPLVDGDKLICSPGGPKAGIVALDKRTGRELWRTPLSFDGKWGNAGASYSSVAISRAAGVKQYVQLMRPGLVGIDAKTGKQLWSYSKLAAINSSCTPIVRGDHVFTPCGWYVGSPLLKLSQSKEGVDYDEVYLLGPQKLSTNSGGAVLVGDHVYGSHVYNGMPQCIEFLTGKSMWEKDRGPGTGPAAALYADGHLYFQYESGDIALVSATPEKYQLKGQFRLPGNGRSLAHPAISNGRLYLRDSDTIYCYDVKKK